MKERRKIYFRAKLPHYFLRGWNEKWQSCTISSVHTPLVIWRSEGCPSTIRHLAILVSFYRKFLKYIVRVMKLWLCAAVLMLSTAHFGHLTDDSRNQQNDVLGHDIGTNYKHHPERSIVLITQLLFEIILIRFYLFN